MNCYDFIHIYVPKQGSNGWINYNDITPVTNWADQGGLVSLMWHFNVPKTESTVPGTNGSGVTCTPSETTFKAANVFTAGSWENKWFYQEMDKVVEVLQKLQDAGVVAVWRPFHEAAGNACLKSGAAGVNPGSGGDMMVPRPTRNSGRPYLITSRTRESTT